MPSEKILSMMGLARRAGKLSMGHDMALQALIKKKAKAVIICQDASPRLIKEFKAFLENNNIDVPLFVIKFTMDEIHFSLGYKAAVMTIDDVNFSNKIISLLRQEEMIYDN